MSWSGVNLVYIVEAGVVQDGNVYLSGRLPREGRNDHRSSGRSIDTRSGHALPLYSRPLEQLQSSLGLHFSAPGQFALASARGFMNAAHSGEC